MRGRQYEVPPTLVGLGARAHPGVLNRWTPRWTSLNTWIDLASRALQGRWPPRQPRTVPAL